MPGKISSCVRGSMLKSKLVLSCATAALLIAGLGADGISPANARSRNEGYYTTSRNAGTPLLAVVGLREQRISIYDAGGKIMEAPVSTGATGYETPAGIYSIVQKEEDHHSNLYDDASMPYMERITWSGMALHAGVLPGYAASHGCVRLPSTFAEQLYGISKLGMRVLVVREDIAPAEIAQPFMFGPSNTSEDGWTSGDRSREASNHYGITSAMSVADNSLSDRRYRLRLAVGAKATEAAAAARREAETRVAASRLGTEAAAAAKALQAAEGNFAKAETDFKAAEHTLQAAGSPAKTAQAQQVKAQAFSRFEVAQMQLQSAQAQAKSKSDAAAQAQEQAREASAARTAALQAVEEAEQKLLPVSVFISRKTQRLYIRKGNQPVFEAPVKIRDADRQIGTFVFTALDNSGPAGSMRWNVVSMYKNATDVEPFSKSKQSGSKKSPPAPADVAAAKAALNRLVITPEAIERISDVVLPGSSLIISDEGPSIETGKDTDFVIFMSGEPQGGIAIRAHHQSTRHDRERRWYDDETPWRSSRSRRSGSSWGGWGGGWGGGFPW